MRLAERKHQPQLVARVRRSARHRSAGWFGLLGLVCLVFPLTAAWAQQQRANEYDVKSAYLYNFGRFVEWPNKSTDKEDLFAICVLGHDPFGAALDAALAGQTVGGQKAVAKRISKAEDAPGCRVLFISGSEDGQLKNIIAVLDHMGILTVSDMPQFSQRGGMIQFVPEGNRVRFEVNLKSVQDAGLMLSSELLKVAVTVRRNG